MDTNTNTAAATRWTDRNSHGVNLCRRHDNRYAATAAVEAEYGQVWGVVEADAALVGGSWTCHHPDH